MTAPRSPARCWSVLIPRIEQNQPVFDPRAVDLNRYTGRYCLPGEYASAEVSARDGLLQIDLLDHETDSMLFAPVGLHQFGPPGSNFPAITFQEDDNGGIDRFDYALFQFQKRP